MTWAIGVEETMIRRLLATLFVTALACTVVAQTESGKVKSGKKEKVTDVRGDPKVVVSDSGTRTASLKRQFELFRNRLSALASRMENGSDKDKETAKRIREALKLASDKGTEAKFESIVNSLRGDGAAGSIDVLRQVVREEAALLKDLAAMKKLLEQDSSALNKEKMKRTAELLEQLKELIAKQERVRAQTEMGRKDTGDLKKDQNKVTKETRDVIDPKGGKNE